MTIYEEALQEFGLDAQLLQQVEECAELTKAIAKFVNRDSSQESLQRVAEELADVHVVAKQIVIALEARGISWEKAKTKAVERLRMRIEEAGCV